MSSYGKCMGFPVNFPQYGKMQQNPWNGESVGKWYSYFSHSMGAFFPSDSHPMVYFSIWEMHGFPHKFPTVRENAKMQQNSWCGESVGNWYSYFSHSMGAYFPLDSHPMAYFIIWEMHGFPHQFLIVRENATKLIVWREQKLILILFPYYGRIFSIRFPFYGILHYMGNACVFSLISHNLGKDSQNHPMRKVWEIDSRKYPTKPIVCGEPGESVLILFP